MCGSSSVCGPVGYAPAFVQVRMRPLIGSNETTAHFDGLPLPPPPPLLVAGAGALGLMLMTVLLMSPPPLASAGEAEAARLSAARPAVIEVRARFIGSPLDAVR